MGADGKSRMGRLVLGERQELGLYIDKNYIFNR